MKILLDTHALLWLITDNEKLSPKAKDIFLDQSNSLFFSAAGFWEVCIKLKSRIERSASPGQDLFNEMESVLKEKL